MEDDTSDFATFTVPVLKAILKARSQSVSGNKQELVARATGCQKLGITPNLGAEDEVSACGILARTFKLLHTPTGYQLPDPDSLTDWEDLTDSPGVCEKDIYNYLVLSHHRTTDNGKIGASRQLKAQTMFKEGHVLCAKFRPVADGSDHGFVEALVTPSLPGKDAKKTRNYNTWICLSKHSGHIHSAQCTCTAG